jgi:hypothetical protein
MQARCLRSQDKCAIFDAGRYDRGTEGGELCEETLVLGAQASRLHLRRFDRLGEWVDARAGADSDPASNAPPQGVSSLQSSDRLAMRVEAEAGEPALLLVADNVSRKNGGRFTTSPQSRFAAIRTACFVRAG